MVSFETCNMLYNSISLLFICLNTCSFLSVLIHCCHMFTTFIMIRQSWLVVEVNAFHILIKKNQTFQILKLKSLQKILIFSLIPVFLGDQPVPGCDKRKMLQCKIKVGEEKNKHGAGDCP